MNHLDEGTIHAWLDHALDPAQSREIEAHVAGCVACSANVAEARGLIAGASRILGALDDVPAGVIPGGAPAAPGKRDGVTPIGAHRDTRRGWRITSWASGIAAVLVGAIVLSTSSKVDRSTQLTQTPATVRAESAGTDLQRVMADETTPLQSNAPAAGTAAAGTGASPRERPLVAPQVGRVAPERREAVPSAPPAAAPSPAAREEALSGRVSGVAVTRSAAANQAKTTVPAAAEPMKPADVAPTLDAVAASSQQRAGSALQQDTVRIRTTAQQDTTRLRTTSSMRLESVVVTGGGAGRDTVAQQFAGCYRTDAPPVAPAPVSVSKGAAASAGQRRAVERTAAPSAAAAPQTSDFSARGLPPVVRLVTAQTARGYTVRAGRDSTIGFWRVVGDSVVVDLGERGAVRLSARQKIDCP